MDKFQFDIGKTSGENIHAFWDYLKTVDSELTEILQSKVDALLPLPEIGSERNVKRQQVNSNIKQAIDAL